MLQGPGENAGAVDIGDGLAAVFKIESHNHPSFIEPYQGAATGVGGIIRDIFTMGARPIALMNSLRFGPLDGPHGARTRRIVEGVVAGIAGYGNSIGIPTVGGEIAFEESLRRQPARQRLLPRHRRGGRARQGQRRGRRQSGLLRRREDRPRRHPRRDDGVGGVRRQVGGEAARGAGRRSVHGEAAARGVPRADADRRADRRAGHGRGGSHVLDLRDGRARRRRHRDRRDARAAARDRHDALRDHAVRIAGAHAARRQEGTRGRGRARSSTSGTCTRRTSATSPTTACCASRITASSSPRFRTRRWSTRRRSTIGRRPAPRYLDEVAAARPSRADRCRRRRSEALLALLAVADDRQQALGLPAVRSHGPDQHAGAGRAWAPAWSASRARSARWRCRSTATAATAISIRAMGAMLAVAEAARNVACAGALPIGATNCLNFGNPERPEIMWQFVEAVEGIGEACRALGHPDHRRQRQPLQRDRRQAIYPTPIIGVVGRARGRVAASWRGRSRRRTTTIVLLGEHDAASSAAASI